MAHPHPPSPGINRRTALRSFAAAAALAAVSRALAQPEPAKPAEKPVPPTPPAKPLFTISLAQWSLHRALQKGTLDHLNFPKISKEEYGIDGVEYVSTFFKKKGNAEYNAELLKRCTDLGVTSVLIMCDGEGALGDPDEKARGKAIENHRKWLEAAKALGCHSIRVNAQSKGTFEEQQKLAADGLRKLSELGETFGLNVIVENHGGMSSNGKWLSGVMKMVDHKRCGTLPDFGNFYEYDRYQGVTDMMPFAKGVSAKSHDFDEKTGEEKGIDYRKMLKIVLDAGYRGRIGIEYEGERMSEPDGIRATKRLLEKIRGEMALSKQP